MSSVKYQLLRDFTRGVRGIALVNAVRHLLPQLPIEYAGAIAQLVRAAYEAGQRVGRGERIGRREFLESLQGQLARELGGSFPRWAYNVETVWGWPGEEGVGRQRTEIIATMPLGLPELQSQSALAMRDLVQKTPYEFGGPEHAGEVILGDVVIVSMFPTF